MTSYQVATKQRVLKTGSAFKAIERARQILAQLETYAEQTADKDFPDLGKVAEKTHALRGEVDQILVGLTEARIGE